MRVSHVKLKKAFDCNCVYIGTPLDENYLIGIELLSVYWCGIFNHFQNSICKTLRVKVLETEDKETNNLRLISKQISDNYSAG